jgi:hypothetical protein
MRNLKRHPKEIFVVLLVLAGLAGMFCVSQIGYVEAKKNPQTRMYEVYSGVTNHGATDASGVTNRALYDILQTIGTSQKATVLFKNDNESGTTTPYKFTTRGEFSSYGNVTFEFEQGAQLEPASGVTIALPFPGNIRYTPEQQLFYINAVGSGVTFYRPGVIRPEMYGADNTGSSDSWKSIDAAVYAVKETDSTDYDQSSTLLLKSGGVYKSGTTLFLGTADTSGGGGPHSVRNVATDGNGKATILVTGAGITGIDWTGTHLKKMENVEIKGDSGATPYMLMLFSRNSHGIGAGLTTLRNVSLRGSATFAGLYNYGSEEMNLDDCEFRVNAPYTVIITAGNEFGVGIPHQDGTLAEESSTDFHFNQCTMENDAKSGTAVNVLHIGSAINVFVNGCQITDDANDISLVKIYQETLGAQPNTIVFTNSLWHGTYLVGLELDGVLRKIIVDKSNRFNGATETDIKSAASTTIHYSYFAAPNIDFSTSTTDLVDGNEIHITSETGGVKLGRYVYADVFVSSGVTRIVYADDEWEGTLHKIDSGVIQTYHPDHLITSGVSTTGTTEVKLMEVSGVSGFRGARFSINAAGVFKDANNGNKSIVLYIGTASGVTVIPAADHSTNDEWSVNVDCYQSKESNTSQICMGSGTTNDTTGLASAVVWRQSVYIPGFNITSGNTVATAGICTNSGDTIYQRLLNVEFK